MQVMNPQRIRFFSSEIWTEASVRTRAISRSNAAASSSFSRAQDLCSEDSPAFSMRDDEQSKARAIPVFLICNVGSLCRLHVNAKKESEPLASPPSSGVPSGGSSSGGSRLGADQILRVSVAPGIPAGNDGPVHRLCLSGKARRTLGTGLRSASWNARRAGALLSSAFEQWHQGVGDFGVVGREPLAEPAEAAESDVELDGRS